MGRKLPLWEKLVVVVCLLATPLSLLYAVWVTYRVWNSGSLLWVIPLILLWAFAFYRMRANNLIRSYVELVTLLFRG